MTSISLHTWVKAQSTLLTNAASLIGTTAVTSVLGFVYWWVAARQFMPESVGVASASVSAMMLLGSLCMLGFGTLLITELPRQPGQEAALISTALIVVGSFGGCIGAVFAVVAPLLVPGFQPLGASVIDVLVFASGVGLTAVTLVLDQALIGILRGGLQLWRNTFFAIAKLVLLFATSYWLAHKTGMVMYATWAMGNALSLAFLLIVIACRGKKPVRAYLPQKGLLRKLGLAALQHHLLNLTLQAPVQALPIVVTAFLSAKMNAWFYVSWMIASFVFVVPTALTTVLHAMNSAQPSTLAHKACVTISLALITSLLANCLLQFDTKQVLGLFGHTYADQAEWCLRILALGAFPLIIKNHYISIRRIQDRIAQAMLSMLPGSLLELGGAALGAHFGGLAGLSLGWIVTICIESLFMFGTVYEVVRPGKPSTILVQDTSEIQAIWLLETAIQPALGQGYIGTEALWLQDTTKLLAIKIHNKAIGTSYSATYMQEEGYEEAGRIARLKPPQLQRYSDTTLVENRMR